MMESCDSPKQPAAAIGGDNKNTVTSAKTDRRSARQEPTYPEKMMESCDSPKQPAAATGGDNKDTVTSAKTDSSSARQEPTYPGKMMESCDSPKQPAAATSGDNKDAVTSAKTDSSYARQEPTYPEKKTGWWSSALLTSFVGILLFLAIILLGCYVHQCKSTGGEYSTDDGAGPPVENAAAPFISTLIILAGNIITAMGKCLNTRSGGLETIFSDVLRPQSTV